MAITTRKSKSTLLSSLPHAVETTLKKQGLNLKTARLRRNLTIEDVAEKIGASRYVVADAERGNPPTGVAVYAALLWTYGLLDQLSAVAEPSRDDEGTALSLNHERARARRPRKLDNDF